MAGAVKILPYYTYSDYVQWEGRWELIDGIPYAMSPQPVPEHQRIAANLCAEFRLALRGCKKQCRAYQPVDYKVAEDTILQPDMLVICGDVHKKFLDFVPALVAEILSPATALKDRHTKFDIYQTQGIPYYLIISCDKQEVEIYHLKEREYQLVKKGRDVDYAFEFVHCKALINFTEIWE